MNNQDMSSFHDDNDKVEAEELLEDCWFFGNLLNTKPRMLRSYSDPCSSSNYNQDSNLSYEETYDSINKRSPALQIKDQTPPKGIQSSSSKSALIRAPSLPTSLEKNQDSQDEEEIEFSMGKLIRQASLNYSHSHPTLPPRKHAHKGVLKIQS